jgi:stage II sporulation protein D
VSRSGFHPVVSRRNAKARFTILSPLMRSFIQSPWAKRFALLLLVFFLMIGLPAAVALTFRHGDRANIETWIHTSDASIQVSVWHTDTNQASMMPLNDYILGVLAAEFQPDSPVDALKAGAVACRTYIIREKTVHSTTQTVAGLHGADVTDSGTVDMPFLSEDEMNKKYGADAPGFLANIRTAIQSTDGLILTYQKKPILAFTTLVTPGKTRDARDVIGSPVPYLKSVPCPDDQTSANRVHVLLFKQSAIVKALSLQAVGVTDVSGAGVDLKNLKVVSTDKLGFVQSVSYGKTVWSGAKFAALLGLPSSNFKLSSDAGNSGIGVGAVTNSTGGTAAAGTAEAGAVQNAAGASGKSGSSGAGSGTAAGSNGDGGGQLTVTTNGVGSGLGMSLNESSALAKSGKSWTAILDTFYPGTTRELDTDFEI